LAASSFLRTLRAEGAITIGAITRSLNERKIPTPRGSRWHVSSVANLLARMQKLEAVRRFGGLDAKEQAAPVSGLVQLARESGLQLPLDARSFAARCNRN
jgi:hypothetical protein